MNTQLAVWLAAAAAMASPLAAQSAAPAFGIGVDQSYRLTLAFALGAGLRLQPEAGYASVSTTLPFSVVGASSNDQEKQSQLHLGAGLYFLRLFPVGTGEESILIYAGPRGGADVQRQSLAGTDQRQTNWWLGVAAGGEYLIARHFSVGAEAQLTKAFPGTPSGTTSNFTFGFSTTEIETRGLVVVRFYPF